MIVSDAVNNREPIRPALNGGKRVHNADELISAIVAKRLVEHLERSGFVVMKNHLSSVNELFTRWPKRVAPIRLLGARR